MREVCIVPVDYHPQPIPPCCVDDGCALPLGVSGLCHMAHCLDRRSIEEAVFVFQARALVRPARSAGGRSCAVSVPPPCVGREPCTAYWKNRSWSPPLLRCSRIGYSKNVPRYTLKGQHIAFTAKLAYRMQHRRDRGCPIPRDFFGARQGANFFGVGFLHKKKCT